MQDEEQKRVAAAVSDELHAGVAAAATMQHVAATDARLQHRSAQLREISEFGQLHVWLQHIAAQGTHRV